MRVLVAVAVWTACSYAPARIGGADPPGDGSDIDGPPGDPDDDGVPTGDDNCPTKANADQHDEDNDGIGDACDPCPHLTGAGSNTDTDGDGIGDACDPRVNEPDVLVLFEPFAKPLLGGWVATVGSLANWSVSGDRLVNANAEQTQQVELEVGGGPHTIDAAIEVTAVSGLIDTTGFGAMIDSNGLLANYYNCFPNTSGNSFNQNFGPGTVTVATNLPGPAFPGRYRVVTSHDGVNLHCRYEGINAPAEQITTQAVLGGTKIGIRLRNVAVRIEYVAVYRSP